MCISVIARVIKRREEYVYFSDCESGCVVFCEFLCCMILVSVVVDDTTTHAKPSTTAQSSELVYHLQKTKKNTKEKIAEPLILHIDFECSET